MNEYSDIEVFVSVYAEISNEYIKRFPDQDCVPQYLETVSQKAGAELISNCEYDDSNNRVYGVKGSWSSVFQARSFLLKFLKTFEQDEVQNKHKPVNRVSDVDETQDISRTLNPHSIKSLRKVPKPIIMYDGIENTMKSENERETYLTKIGRLGLAMPTPTESTVTTKSLTNKSNQKKTVDIEGDDSKINKEISVGKNEEKVSNLGEDTEDDDDATEVTVEFGADKQSSDSDRCNDLVPQRTKLKSSKTSKSFKNRKCLGTNTKIKSTISKLNTKVKVGSSDCTKRKKDLIKNKCQDLSKKSVSSVKSSNVVEDYKCLECTFTAKKKSGLKEHNRRVHKTIKFTCTLCEREFGYDKDLKKHMNSHKKPQNCCDICGKLYKGVRTLSEHRKTHADNYAKPEYNCTLCDKSFSTKYVLAYHIKSNHLGIKRTYLCPTCGKSFSQKHSYLQHANVHLGIRPFKCDVCEKTFAYEKSLKEHRFMHDNLRRFKCDHCDKCFRQSSALIIHSRIHKEKKDYVCSSCGRGFCQKQSLKRHERIHLGEKPFVCELCNRNFTDSSVLRRHMIHIHKKHPKQWRDDTVTHIQRAQYFIDVVNKTSEELAKDAMKGNMTDLEEENLTALKSYKIEEKKLSEFESESTLEVVNQSPEADISSHETENKILSPHDSQSSITVTVSEDSSYLAGNTTTTLLSVPSLPSSHVVSSSSYNVPMYSHLQQGVYSHPHYIQSQPVNLHTLENLQPHPPPEFYPHNYHIQPQ